MQFTTQKSQLKEYQFQLKLERRAFIKRTLDSIFQYACGCVALLAPTLVLVLGWIKD